MPKKKSDIQSVASNAPVSTRGAAAAPAKESKPARKRTSAVTHRHKKQTVPETGPAEFELNREEIAQLAYSYWEDRGFQGGSPEEDWFRAEQELRQLAVNSKVML